MMSLPDPFPQFNLSPALRHRPFDTIALGNAMMEMIIRVDEWPGAGGQRDMPILPPVYTAGGCATNVACFTGRLGGRVALVARLGDGRYSQPIWDEYARSGVDTTYVRRFPGKAGNLVIIMTRPGGDWSVMSYMDPHLELTPADLPPDDLFARAKILYLDGFSLFNNHQKQAVEQAIQKAKSAGCLIATDASVPLAQSQPDYLAHIFGQSDFVFANRAESLAVTGTTTVEAALHSFQTMGPQACFVKLGQKGSFVITPAGVGHIPAYQTSVVDTVAAGDAYLATTLLGLCRGQSLQASATQGSAAAALACLGAGSLSSHFGLDAVANVVKQDQTYLE